MHHPIYSADTFHSGSAYMGTILDQAIQASGRVPDAVFAGHVHNYQRFTRTINGRNVPYIVTGSGGYWHLHKVIQVQGQPIQTPYPVPSSDVTLESYSDDHHGYLLMTVDRTTLTARYFAVPTQRDPANAPSQQIDAFTLNLATHQLQ
jgi:hypothetical protein